MPLPPPPPPPPLLLLLLLQALGGAAADAEAAAPVSRRPFTTASHEIASAVAPAPLHFTTVTGTPPMAQQWSPIQAMSLMLLQLLFFVLLIWFAVRTATNYIEKERSLWVGAGEQSTDVETTYWATKDDEGTVPELHKACCGHEKQVAQLCGVHAVNNVLGMPELLKAHDLDRIASQLHPTHRSFLGTNPSCSFLVRF
eukprot:SAG31_NODE_3238_length_4507_cov_14.674682_1_plen_198_part_00